jgi:transposase
MIVRESGQTVRNWFKRYEAEGSAGLQDRPMPGAPGKVTPAYAEQVCTAARQRPRSLGQPYSLWTLERLADYMAEQTGIRVSFETVRRLLAAAEIVLSRPQHKISSPDPEYLVKKRRSKTSVTA